jgi:endonuclease/exonuclease/phosphatase family metal-dependent hydrolase
MRARAPYARPELSRERASVRVVTYNIRKGKGADGRSAVEMRRLGAALAGQAVDIALCQEVFHCARTGDSQTERLAEALGFASYYGQNKLRAAGHHGNSTFTRLEVERHENHDLSVNRVERRGALYARMRLAGRALHVFNVHLGLSGGQRRAQIDRISDLVHRLVRDDEQVLLAGDFNDWGRALTDAVCREMGFTDVFADYLGKDVRTWHARRPVFALDRIYVRNLRPVRAERLTGKPWADLSDHLPLVAELSPP